MPELGESRVREIIRDELSVMQIPEQLAGIKGELSTIREQNKFILKTLEQKADKVELEVLRQEMKEEINSLREEVKGQFKSLEVEQKLTRDFIKYNSRLTTGFFIAIFTLLVGIMIKLMI